MSSNEDSEQKHLEQGRRSTNFGLAQQSRPQVFKGKADAGCPRVPVAVGESCPPKAHQCPNPVPVRVTLFGHTVFAGVIKLRTSIRNPGLPWWALNPMTVSFKEKGKEHSRQGHTEVEEVCQ